MSRKKRKVFLMLVCVGLLLCVVSMQSWASDLEREQTEVGKMLHKLGRGVTNVLTGWIEIPYNIAETWKKTDPFTGLVAGGIKGIAWGWARTCTGFYDIFTFPFALPAGYEPLMEPEYILPEIWGEPFPHYAE